MNIDNYQGDSAELAAKIKAGFEQNVQKIALILSIRPNIEKFIIIRDGKAIQLTRKQVSKERPP